MRNILILGFLFLGFSCKSSQKVPVKTVSDCRTFYKFSEDVDKAIVELDTYLKSIGDTSKRAMEVSYEIYMTHRFQLNYFRYYNCPEEILKVNRKSNKFVRFSNGLTVQFHTTFDEFWGIENLSADSSYRNMNVLYSEFRIVDDYGEKFYKNWYFENTPQGQRLRFTR